MLFSRNPYNNQKDYISNFDISLRIMKLKLNVKGMHCKSCEELIKEDFQDINVKAEVSYRTGILNIEFDEKQTNLNKIKEVIEKLGYKLE